MMQIEKVSKYVVVQSPYGSGNGTTHRRMLLSLPRVRWLERDGDYVPPTIDDQAQEEDQGKKNGPPIYVTQPIRPREQRAYDLWKGGKTPLEVAEHMGVPLTAARTYLTSARKKIMYQKNKD